VGYLVDIDNGIDVARVFADEGLMQVLRCADVDMGVVSLLV
jgi:hypothetical protein